MDRLCSEFQGHCPSIRIGDFDTRVPRNVDDNDLSSESTDGLCVLPDGGRFTEMTLSLTRISALRALMHLDQWFQGQVFLSQNFEKGAVDFRAANHGKQRLKGIVIDAKLHQEENYLRFCGGDDPMQQLCRLVGDVAEIKLWLFCYRLLSAEAAQRNQEMGANDQKEYISLLYSWLLLKLKMRNEFWNFFFFFLFFFFCIG